MNRTIIIIILATILVALTGCIGPFAGGGGPEKPVDYVSNDAQIAINFNPDVLYLNSTERLIEQFFTVKANVTIRETGEYNGTMNYTHWITNIEGDINPLLSESDRVILYGSSENIFFGDDYFAGMFVSDWGSDVNVENYLSEVEGGVEEQSYKEVPVYVIDDENAWGTHVAVLDEETIIMGTETAVKDSINISVGDADPLGGELKTEMESFNESDVYFATYDPAEVIATTLGVDLEEDAPVDVLSGLVVASGTYNADGEEIDIRTDLVMDSADSASQSRSQINLGIALLNSEDPEGIISEIVDVSDEENEVKLTIDANVDQLIHVMGLAEEIQPEDLENQSG